MKVLFVGEGAHDVGSPDFALKPRPAQGVVPALANRVCPSIASESVALYWREIPVLDRAKKKKGLAAKVASAILLAVRDGCGGTICVHDLDGDDTRLPEMEEGKQRGLALVSGNHQAVCGVAIQSIEAWTLGAPTALAAVLNQPVGELHQIYQVKDVESFKERSGNPDKQSKKLLAQVMALSHQEDSTALREQVAQATDVAELRRHCPLGFQPFAAKLQAAFGPNTAEPRPLSEPRPKGSGGEEPLPYGRGSLPKLPRTLRSSSAKRNQTAPFPALIPLCHFPKRREIIKCSCTKDERTGIPWACSLIGKFVNKSKSNPSPRKRRGRGWCLSAYRAMGTTFASAANSRSLPMSMEH